MRVQPQIRMLKRCIAALCAAAAVVLLSGCTKTADVNLRLVVHAVGIDVDEDGIYTVSAQVFSAQHPDGGGPVDATGNNILTMVVYGRSMAEVKKSLELQTGKEVLVGNIELIVLGSSMADQDISRVLSYFWENREVYMGVNVAFCRGMAVDVVSAQFEHGTATSELLNQMILSAGDMGVTIPARLISISNRLNEESSGFLMPVFTAEKAELPIEDAGEGMYDKAIGVFDSVLVVNGKPQEYLSSRESVGVSVMTKSAKRLEWVLEVDGELTAVEVKIGRVKRKVSLGDNGLPRLDITIAGTLRVTDNPAAVSEEEIVRAVQNELLECCRAAYLKTAVSCPCDALEIGRLVRSRLGGDYTDGESVIDIISDTTVSVDASFRIYDRW